MSTLEEHGPPSPLPGGRHYARIGDDAPNRPNAHEDRSAASEDAATPDRPLDTATGRPLERRRVGRATQTLQATWLDPEETPFTPVPRPGKAVPARLFSLLIAAAILGLMAWLIVPEVSFRLANTDTVTLSDGVLTAQPVPLAPTEAATVEELFVDATNPPDSVLPAGTPIARLRGATNSDGSPRAVELSVPFDARLASVDTLEGSVTLPGTPVATVYDPSKMTVIVTVSPATLDRLRQGMRAELTSGLLSAPIQGTVISAIPLLGTDYDPTNEKLVNVRIKPDGDGIANLVPGIRFEARVDLGSAPDGAEPLVFSSSGVSDLETRAASIDGS